MKKPKLSPDDQAWLDSYRSAIAARFGPLVSSIIVFGSKAGEIQRRIRTWISCS